MRKAFVMMPFRQPFDSYYPTVFKPALEACGFTVLRADDIYTPRPVMLDIQESILASDIILCEMTGRNPNVFYELGMAHAVGKPAILLSSEAEDIPFDLQHVRVIHYETQSEGWREKLSQAIQKAALAAVAPGNLWPPPLTLTPNQNRDSGRNIIPQTTSRDDGDPRIVDRPINLGFDGPVEAGFPHGWFNSVGHVRGVSANYGVRVIDREDSKRGQCLMIVKQTAAYGEFGSVMQRFPADFLAGRVVRLEGELCSHDIQGWAGLWLRADGQTTPDLFFDNMSGHRIEGTTGWRCHTLEGRLPKESAWLNFGVVLSGSGALWADNFRLLFWSDQQTWVDV